MRKPSEAADQTTDQERQLLSLAAAPPDPVEDEPVELTLASHYQGYSVQELADANLKAEAALREVEEQLRTADSWLSEAMRKDETLFSAETGGPEVARAAPHYREAQERLAGLIPRRWALDRRAMALGLAARLAKLVELEQEIQTRHPEIAKREEEIQRLQDELNALRFEQQDALSERRDIAITKHEAARYQELARGPQVKGLAAALLSGNGASEAGAERSGWSKNRIIM